MLRTYTPDPRLYEMVTILSPDVSEEDIPGQVDSIAGYVTTAGGNVDEILRDSPWGRRRLAYTVRHAGRDIRDGYYTVFHITLDPGGVRDIERDLKLNDQVIRFLITHYTPKPVQPGQTPEGGAAIAPVGDATSAQPTGAEAPAPSSAPEAVVASPDEPEALLAPLDQTQDGRSGEPEAASAIEPSDDAVSDIEGVEPVDQTDASAEPAESMTSTIVVGSTESAAVAELEAEVETVDIEPSDVPVEAEATLVESTAAVDPTVPAEPTAPAKDTEEA